MSRQRPSLNGSPPPLIRSLACLSTGCAFLLMVMAAANTGCSGINATKSISPLDFILPGLMHNSPPPPLNPLPADTATLLAHATPVPL